MVQCIEAVAGGFGAEQPHLRIANEGGKDSYGIAAPADTGEHRLRQPAFSLQYLLAGFVADDTLEISHHV